MKKLFLFCLIISCNFVVAGPPDKLDVCRHNPSEEGLYDRVDQYWIGDDHGALDCEDPGYEKCEWESFSNSYNFEKITFDLIKNYILTGKTSGTVNISGVSYLYYILEGLPDYTGKVRFIKQPLN